MDTLTTVEHMASEGARWTPTEIDIPTKDIEIIADLLKTTHGLIAFGILATLVGFYLYLRSTK